MLRYFTEIGTCGANYITVVEVRPILSATRMLPKDSSFRQYMIYSDALVSAIVTEGKCVNDRPRTRQQIFELLTLRGHVSYS